MIRIFFKVTILSLLAVLFWTGNASAMTITEFDQLNDEGKGKVIFDVVRDNTKQLFELDQGLAACMVALFKGQTLENNQIINVGSGTVMKQMDVYREQDPDNIHVEKIVDAVFKHLLKNKCIPEKEKQENDIKE